MAAGGCEKKDTAGSKTSAPTTEQPRSYVTTSDVRVRAGAGTQYKAVADIPRGTKVSVVGREGEWLKVVSKHGNPPGYINERFAQPEGKQRPPQALGLYLITAETYVREGPGLHYRTITKVPKGTTIHVADAEGDWLKVESKHGRRPGYVERIYAQPASGR